MVLITIACLSFPAANRMYSSPHYTRSHITNLNQPYEYPQSRTFTQLAVLLGEITGSNIAIIPFSLAFKRAKVVNRGMKRVLESNLYYFLTLRGGGETYNL